MISEVNLMPSPPLASALLILSLPIEPSARSTIEVVSFSNSVLTTAGPMMGLSGRWPAKPSASTAAPARASR